MSIFKETIAYRPFNYPWAMDMAVEHNIALYWDTHQLDLSSDLPQFHNEGGLETANVSHASNKNMLEKMLSLFTQMDVAAGSLYRVLMPHVKNNEISNMWMAFSNREGAHQRAYALGVEEFGFPESTWSEFMEYDEMFKKIDLMTNLHSRDLTNKLDFSKTVAQLLLAEGICLFGAFACMLNLKRFGLLLGFNLVNEWSLRDEQKHVEGNMRVLAEVRKELSSGENLELDMFIKDLVEQFILAEDNFIDTVFEMGPQEGMTAQDMKNYIRYLGDLRLKQLKLPTTYGVEENPLEWMDWILTGKKHGNFFEKKVTDYDHSGLVGEIDYSVYQ